MSEFRPAEYSAGVASMVQQEVKEWGIELTMDEQSRLADEVYRVLNAARVRHANNILKEGI